VAELNEKEERKSEFRNLLKEIKAEEEQELKSMAKGGELGLKMDEDLEAEYTNLLKQSGLNVEQLEQKERKDVEATEKWVAEVTPVLVMGDEQQLVLQQLAEEREHELDKSVAGGDIEILTPAEVTVSDTDILTMDWIPSKLCWDGSSLARGTGTGCVGGSAWRRVCADWWYSFKPGKTKWYNVVPYVVYNGFYIVNAPEHYWNCRYAKAKIDIGVNVHQYDWKGWSWWNILNLEGSDISVFRRFDNNRRADYAALLRRDVLTWIRVRTCLYVYAKGSGSYAEFDFSTGSNRICAPWLYVG
jgi:hypothetical protein